MLRIHPIVLIILFLSVFYIGYSLLHASVATIGITIAVLVCLFLLYTFVAKRYMPNQNYTKAVKQSKKLHTVRIVKPKPQQTTAVKKRTIKKRPIPSHLTVIEGKKGKKKDRASL